MAFLSVQPYNQFPNTDAQGKEIDQGAMQRGTEEAFPALRRMHDDLHPSDSEF
jgi:hypothetical protein